MFVEQLFNVRVWCSSHLEGGGVMSLLLFKQWFVTIFSTHTHTCSHTHKQTNKQTQTNKHTHTNKQTHKQTHTHTHTLAFLLAWFIYLSNTEAFKNLVVHVQQPTRARLVTHQTSFALFSRVTDGDTLCFIDFRADRMRQITEAFGIKPPFETDTIPKDVVSSNCCNIVVYWASTCCGILLLCYLIIKFTLNCSMLLQECLNFDTFR